MAIKPAMCRRLPFVVSVAVLVIVNLAERAWYGQVAWLHGASRLIVDQSDGALPVCRRSTQRPDDTAPQIS